MKQIIYWILAWTFMSCADDLGNYDYHDLQDIKIEGIPSSITAVAFQHLSIPVKLQGTALADGRYEYLWLTQREYLKDDRTVVRTDTLARTQNLDEIISLPPAKNYTLIYTIKDKDTGVFYRQTADLSVITTTSEGWVVLCAEEGKVRLDMVANIDGENVYSRNMLAKSGMPYQHSPKALLDMYTEGGEVDPNATFYLLTEEGATRLGNEAFEWNPEYDLKYEMGEVFTPKASVILAYGPFRMLVDGTDVYYSDMMQSGPFFDKLNYVRDEDLSRKTFKAAPYMGCNVALGILNQGAFAPLFVTYDLEQKKFIFYKGGYYGAITGDMTSGFEYRETVTDAVTKANVALPVGYDYIYMENTRYNTEIFEGKYSLTYTILDDGSRYRLYGLYLGDALWELPEMGDMPAVMKGFEADLSGCENIREASNFAFYSGNHQMFYSVGPKIFRVDLDGAPLTADKPFDLGENITCMKFLLSRDEAGVERQNKLIVGTEAGVLRIYDMPQVGSPFAGNPTPEVYEGFAEIIDVIYKAQY